MAITDALLRLTANDAIADKALITSLTITTGCAFDQFLGVRDTIAAAAPNLKAASTYSFPSLLPLIPQAAHYILFLDRNDNDKLAVSTSLNG